MKTMRKLFTVLLALAMTLTLAVSAFAADTAGSITITNPQGDRTYTAYKIFDVTYSGDNYSYTISDTDAAYSAVKAYADVSTNGLKLTAVANTNKYNVSIGAEFSAASFAQHLKANVGSLGTGTAFTKADNTMKASGLALGYYFVSGTSGSVCELTTAKDIQIRDKNEVPQIEKSVDDADGTVEVGQVLTYTINGKVPSTKGYTEFTYQVTDTMSAGLTYNKDVAIKIGTTTLAPTAYDVTYDDTANTMKIVIKDFIQYKSEAGKDIVVTYSATLNEKADLTQAGNKNTVKLTYSNNPNVDYKGDNEPDSTDPVGETPEHVTVTYSTTLQLTKVDGADHNVKLEGVEFQITGTSIKTAVSKGEYFKQDADGTYYQLKDGTFTETAPTTETESKYVSNSVKYAKVTDSTEQTKMQKVTASGTTDANGLITFEGLGAGTYYITELKTLGGYNLLTAPITVEIKATPGTTSCTWTAKVNGENATFEDDMVKLTVENNKGSVLPITGGIGTTIFYVIGGLLVCGAVVMAITKKKLSVEDKADQN